MKQPLLDVQSLSKQYRMDGHLFYAVQDLSFTLEKGEILGVGGESGCGKSTVAKILMGLVEPSQGEILFEGEPLSNLMRRRSQGWRRRLQMVFQHPAASLNPSMKIRRILEEPFLIHGWGEVEDKKERLEELLTQVGLPGSFLSRMPHELSGGQKQRVAIARALSLNPSLLICDEPFSALDVTTQVQVTELLAKLHQEHQLTYVVISHDLSLLRAFTHRLLIMYMGQVMELGPSEAVYTDPLHPYSQALASSILSLSPIRKSSTHIAVKGEVPSLKSLSAGCPFYGRCPHAQKICEKEKPILKEVRPGHFAACHLL